MYIYIYSAVLPYEFGPQSIEPAAATRRTQRCHECPLPDQRDAEVAGECAIAGSSHSGAFGGDFG